MPGRRRRYVKHWRVSWPCTADINRIARNASILAACVAAHSVASTLSTCCQSSHVGAVTARLTRYATLRSVRRPFALRQFEENSSRSNLKDFDALTSISARDRSTNPKWCLACEWRARACAIRHRSRVFADDGCRGYRRICFSEFDYVEHLRNNSYVKNYTVTRACTSHAIH